jgi:hypothetical protein
MPNWCSNRMTVSGPKSVVDLFVERAKGVTPDYLPNPHDLDADKEVEGLLCFNKFAPVPQGLLERTFGGEKEKAENPNLSRIDGCVCGYDWQSENWGCKWDASNITFERRTPKTAYYEFDTAWAPPVALMEKIAEMSEFKELQIDLEYMEPGMMFCGSTLVKDGQCSDAPEEAEQSDVKEWYGWEDDEEVEA